MHQRIKVSCPINGPNQVKTLTFIGLPDEKDDSGELIQLSCRR